MNVFFSWQSDLNRAHNTNAIGLALQNAKKELEDDDDNLEIELLEATRNEAGAINILEAIFNKISEADIFVADITIVNNADKPKRPMPNPNVMIELGFAVAFLGWARVILLSNEVYTKSLDDLPFDINKYRVSTFSYDKNSDQKQLNNLLKECLKTIIDKKPRHGYNKDNLQIIKREKDLVQLQKLLEFFNIQLFDRFIEELPDRIVNKILVYNDYFDSLNRSTNFKFYDCTLDYLVKNFIGHFNNCLRYPKNYRGAPNCNDLVFDPYMGCFKRDEDEKVYDFVENEKTEFAKALNDLVNYLRVTYPEIDLERVSKQAAENYEKL